MLGFIFQHHGEHLGEVMFPGWNRNQLNRGFNPRDQPGFFRNWWLEWLEWTGRWQPIDVRGPKFPWGRVGRRGESILLGYAVDMLDMWGISHSKYLIAPNTSKYMYSIHCAETFISDVYKPKVAMQRPVKSRKCQEPWPRPRLTGYNLGQATTTQYIGVTLW